MIDVRKLRLADRLALTPAGKARCRYLARECLAALVATAVVSVILNTGLVLRLVHFLATAFMPER